MNFRTFLLMCISVTVISSCNSSNEEKELEVSVIVETAKVPLSVQHRFDEVGKALPNPGQLSVDDEHDKKHDSQTYCYRYIKNDKNLLLEFFDSDFGVHTARLSQLDKASSIQCTELSIEPKFIIDRIRFGINDSNLPMLEGFVTKSKADEITMTREWAFTDSNNSCSYRAVTVSTKINKAGLNVITVQNWEEPGC